jgi:site-specific recombinase XerD
MKRRRRTQSQLQNIEDEAQEWLINKAGKAPSTFTHCRTTIIYFQEYLQSKYDTDTPISDFLDKLDANEELPRRTRKKVAETEINGFITYLQKKGLASGTSIGYISKIRQFLTFKNYAIDPSLLNIPKYIPVKKNRKHAWTLEEMREFVDKARSVRDKAFIMCSFQSGLDVDTLLKLNYGDVMKDLEANKLPVLIDVPQGRSKTGLPFKTFFGADAMYYLRIYLDTRNNLQHDSPLFTKIGSEKRLTYEGIYKRIDALANQMSFIKDWELEGWNPVRIHSLRSAFSSCLTGKMSDKLIEFLMGHSLGSSEKHYLQLPEEELRHLYADSERYLAIRSTSKAESLVTGSGAHIQKQIQAQNEKIINLTTTINTLQEQNIATQNEFRLQLSTILEALQLIVTPDPQFTPAERLHLLHHSLKQSLEDFQAERKKYPIPLKVQYVEYTDKGIKAGVKDKTLEVLEALPKIPDSPLIQQAKKTKPLNLPKP